MMKGFRNLREKENKRKCQGLKNHRSTRQSKEITSIVIIYGQHTELAHHNLVYYQCHRGSQHSKTPGPFSQIPTQSQCCITSPIKTLGNQSNPSTKATKP